MTSMTLCVTRRLKYSSGTLDLVWLVASFDAHLSSELRCVQAEQQKDALHTLVEVVAHANEKLGVSCQVNKAILWLRAGAALVELEQEKCVRLQYVCLQVNTLLRFIPCKESGEFNAMVIVSSRSHAMWLRGVCLRRDSS